MQRDKPLPQLQSGDDRLYWDQVCMQTSPSHTSPSHTSPSSHISIHTHLHPHTSPSSHIPIITHPHPHTSSHISFTSVYMCVLLVHFCCVVVMVLLFHSKVIEVYSKKNGKPPSWFSASWLFVECFMYRKIFDVLQMR